ncbi:MAG: hypothetical protein Q8P68_01185 [Candidatus Peregrinibacteria bacterium]|nr:hypothetical protein [Candidatus Peregrinibacteria bacterium]MDZ4244316.1 hypothetical protein [Candidatus Gracilibacteria bacterium]
MAASTETGEVSRFEDVPEGAYLDSLLGGKAELSGEVTLRGSSNAPVFIYRSDGMQVVPKGEDITIEVCGDRGRVTRFVINHVTGPEELGLSPEYTLSEILAAVKEGIRLFSEADRS